MTADHRPDEGWLHAGASLRVSRVDEVHAGDDDWIHHDPNGPVKPLVELGAEHPSPPEK